MSDEITPRIERLLDVLSSSYGSEPVDAEVHAVATIAADILDQIANTADHDVPAAAQSVLAAIVALDVCRVRGGVPGDACSAMPAKAARLSRSCRPSARRPST